MGEIKDKANEAEANNRQHGRKRSRKRKPGILDFLIGAVFLAGVGILSYPTVSNLLNQWHMSQAVTNYERHLKDYAEQDYSDAFEKAREYNRRLKESPNRWSEEQRVPGYEEALRVDESGIMGYLTIEKIRVRLPFYHGTDDTVLDTAIGHFEGTTLPIGDKGDHAVLSAHRGLPSAKLFTDLPKLEVGDEFVLNVLDRTFTYKVDQILTVLPDSPEAVKALEFEEDEDYVTLMTCTPYGINTHRLLVRGRRVD